MREEKVNERIGKAEKLGLHLALEGGLIVVRKPRDVDFASAKEIMADLAKDLPPLRMVLERRAVTARGMDLIGQSVWHVEYGEGVLKGAFSEGRLNVSVLNPDLPPNVGASCSDILVLLEEPSSEATAAALQGAESSSSKGPISFLRDRFGRRS